MKKTFMHEGNHFELEADFIDNEYRIRVKKNGRRLYSLGVSDEALADMGIAARFDPIPKLIQLMEDEARSNRIKELMHALKEDAENKKDPA